MRIKYICESCSYNGQVESDDYETETECSEEGMGRKTEYWTTIESECQECGNSISTTMNQTEYPEGDLSSPSFDDSHGASFYI
ncbi:hypothetical protein [Aeromonas hydrophila]|uniref:hypothetical protein n=1 Tax=Aeromonas hydrophila TaxID=644 RepID=UPI0023657887|nr:hypothetical protein [Aeromonas hydrophila]WDF89684.1 hypothetical protein PUB83_16515 [Aeromonas hydrophila subsp. hydrophila]